MNLGEIFNQVLVETGKDFFGNIITPQNFEEAVNNYIQLDLLDDYVKEYESTRQISTDLFPFVKTLGSPEYPAMALTSYGQDFCYGTKPTDFYYFVRSSYLQFDNTCGGYTSEYSSIEWLSQADFDYRVGTAALFPTKDVPIMTVQNEKLLICPILSRISFTYIRVPRDIVFGYTVTDAGNIVYDANTSVELEWPESAQTEIIRRLVAYYGRSIASQLDMSMPEKKPE